MTEAAVRDKEPVPIRIYSDLAELIAENPAHDCIYLTLDKGAWCFWDGTAFVVGGVYGDLIDGEEADNGWNN